MADRSITRWRPSLRCTASSPEIQTRAASWFFLGLLPVVALEGAFLVLAGRLLPVAVVGLVVQGQDALEAHQARHDPLEHLPHRLLRSQLRSRQRQRLARHERVVVGDDDLRPLQVAEHVAGHELAAGVVAVRVVRLQHPEPVPDRDAGSDHQEPARESLAARPADRVDRLPGDDHRHDRGLAGAGGELQGQPREAGVSFLAGGVHLIDELLPLLAERRSHLGQPDRSLHRFDLAEEGPDIAEPVAAPVLEEPRRLGRHPPRGRVRQFAPPIHAVAHAADEGRQVVLLGAGLERLRGGVEDDLGLSFLLLLGFGDRRDERHLAPLGNDPVRRLAGLVELPVLRGVLVGRVQDRLLEESPIHEGFAPVPATVRHEIR